jgi:F-type H+-transporting ATPase subunit b
MLVQTRREVAELIARAQKAADDLREADIAATRAELERLRVKATADIAAEHDRVLADLRSQVADLALDAAGKLVGESMTDARQRRLVEEFIRSRSEPQQGRKN